MAYIQGSTNGIFELLEIIKNLATSQGWEVLGDVSTPYNDIPRDARHCIIASGNNNTINSNFTISGNNLNIIFPREISLNSISFVGNATLSIYNIKSDQTSELIAENVSSGYEFSDEIKNKKIIQLRITASANFSDLHLNFTSQNANLSRYLVLKNNLPNDNQVVLHFEAYIEPNGRANLAVASSTGYSPALPIENQLNSKVGYILGDDGEIKYRLNINASRLILTTIIHRADHSSQPNEYYQMAYLGRIRLYGGEWALPDCNALIAPSFTSAHWSETPKSNITDPQIYFSGAFNATKSTAFSSATTNANNCNITAPEGGEIFTTPIICYNGSNVFGELDGLLNIILPDNANRGDTISVGGSDYIIVTSGVGFNKYDCFAMIKE